MLQAPPRRPGDDFRGKWGMNSRIIPSDLIGKIVKTEVELKGLFPEDDKFEIYLEKEIEAGSLFEKGYSIYARKRNSEYAIPFYIAYKCNGCENIIIGMPEVKDEDDLGLYLSPKEKLFHEAPPLAGRTGYHVSCTHCHDKLESVILGWS